MDVDGLKMFSSGTVVKTTDMFPAVNDWRTKWNLDMRYADATPEDLIRDMADIHVHIRLKVVILL